MAEEKFVQVSAVDPSKKNSAFTGDQVGDSQPSPAEGDSCFWNGAYYADGTSVCAEGSLYWCQNGAWARGGSC